MSTHANTKLVRILQEFSIPLILGVVAAVALANGAPHTYDAFVHYSPFGHHHPINVHFVMNDIFMVLFFGLAAKEITEAALPGGDLNPPKKAVNPLFGTLGGVLGPVGAYFLWVGLTGDPGIVNGWGIPTATDIALAWLVARIVFGAQHPAVKYLLLLAVADDGLGLAIIAVFYPDPAHPVQPAYLVLVGLGMVGAWGLRRYRVVDYRPYLLGPGFLSWFGLYSAHLHPALALVAVVPFMPSAERDYGLFAGSQNQTDTLNRFEHAFKLPVDVGLFGFGLANAGVAFSAVGNATFAVLFGLVAGKTVGIFTFSWVADRFGARLPEGMDLRSLLCAALTAGLGLTVALFVAGVAFTDPTLQGAAKMGALASAFVAPAVIVLGRILGVGPQRAPASAPGAPALADPSSQPSS